MKSFLIDDLREWFSWYQPSIYRWYLLTVAKFNSNLYCICLSITQIYTQGDAVQICGKFWGHSAYILWSRENFKRYKYKPEQMNVVYRCSTCKQSSCNLDTSIRGGGEGGYIYNVNHSTTPTPTKRPAPSRVYLDRTQTSTYDWEFSFIEMSIHLYFLLLLYFLSSILDSFVKKVLIV